MDTAPVAQPAPHAEQHPATKAGPDADAVRISTPPGLPGAAGPPAGPHPARSRLIGAAVVVVLLLAGTPWAIHELHTVSTDDAYVNGHVTFVAPRVPGQVTRVLVDDNNRVSKGDLLVQLDKEPYQVQVDTARAAVSVAQADLTAAQAQVRGQAGQARSLRFALEHAIEDVNNQVAVLGSKIATLESQKASLAKAQADYDRALPLQSAGGVSAQEIDLRKEAMLVAKARVDEALQRVYQIRASLGLPGKPPEGQSLSDVPADLDQTFSSVRQAQASLIQAVAQIGVSESFNKTPKQMVADFYKRDPQGDIDRIYAQIFKEAPGVKQAQAKLEQAQRVLQQAELNLRYCDVIAEIDGVITRREVNPGNNVVTGQNLMALRSLTDIWVDANFKETQLSSLRIGQAVDLDVDMYGGRHRFRGRISGFTMGTGSTLALLPAENATGNFVKVVQRLPVRVDLVDYDPAKMPLFVGLSVTPTVLLNEPPSGDNAGQVLQPVLSVPRAVPAADVLPQPGAVPPSTPGPGAAIPSPGLVRPSPAATSGPLP